ncbi:MAG: hypothetical protein ABFS45_26665, partial [Pseudomonadota bacterium]
MTVHELQLSRDSIIAVVQAVTIHAADEFSWFGRREGRLPTTIRQALDPATTRAHLINQLQQRLYKSFYSAGYPASEIEEEGLSDPGGNPAFVNSLSAANHGKGNWLHGWTVRAVKHNNVYIQRAGLELCARREYCRPTQGHSLQNG